MGKIKKEKSVKEKKPKLSREEKLLNEYGISEKYDEEDGFRLKIVSIVLRKKTFKILLITFIFAMFICMLAYINGLRESKAVMMLNYEQSVEGLAPNETRFNISDFTSDEVIKMIIKNAGLDGVITTEEMKKSITINTVANKKPSNQENYYIPTSYRIIYKNPRVIKDIKSKNMLEIICNTYSQYFDNQSIMNPQVLNGDYASLDKMEYAEIGAYFKLRIDAITRYLDMRIKESGKFKSRNTGETFRSIKKMVDNLNDYNLNNYNAYIWENGIVKERQKYIDTLSYLKNTNGRENTENMNEYIIRRDVIEYYNSIMSTSILIPTINSKNNYYMARTKTGVDYLASEAEYYLETAKNIEKDIEINEDKLSKLKSMAVSREYEKADKMIKDMTKEIRRIERLAIQNDNEYKTEQAKNFITYKEEQIRFLSRLPKKTIILITLIFMLMVFYVYYKECSCVAKRGGDK